MKHAMYTTNDHDLDGWADMQYAVYIGPRWRIATVQKSRPTWRYFPIEEITKREPYLRLSGVLGETTPLILDRVSRYYRVGSETSRRLAHLTTNKCHVLLLDIVPFCADVQYLYMPWRYIDRGILGYAHYYAFRENYAEEQSDGTLVLAHDFQHLSHKLLSHCRVLRLQAMIRPAHITVSATREEIVSYAQRKEELFSQYKTPQPIVTRLADIAHAFASRRETLAALIEEAQPPLAVVCNLQKYSVALKGYTKKAFMPASYDSIPEQFTDCRTVIYAEPPIVQSYRIFDIDAALPEHCRVYRIIGDMKVDHYLDGCLSREVAQVDGFLRTLSQESANASL